MSETPRELSREEVARIEVGHTAVTRTTAWLLIAVFLGTAAAVPLAQHVVEVRRYLRGERGRAVPGAYDVFTVLPHAARAGWRGESLFRRVINANAATLAAMDRYERGLEEDFVLRPHLLPQVQLALAGALRWSNEQAYLGRDGWLFYRPDVDYVTGPGFLSRRHIRKRESDRKEWQDRVYTDPVAAVVDFAEQLERRGIALVVMPTPLKPTVHPERFSARFEGVRRPLRNPSFDRFKAALMTHGIPVFDCAEQLVQARLQSGEAQYLAADTHWTPQAMQRVVAGLHRFIAARAALTPARPQRYARREVEVTNLGDVAVMLQLPSRQRLFDRETVRVQQVTMTEARGYLWRSDRQADVLVLGDSFSNIYSLDAMGWGEAAGLVEQLSVLMRRPLDRIVRNDDGAFATRQALARELAHGRDRLAGKKLVIWQFAERELFSGNWKPVELRLGERKPSSFVAPAKGGELTFRGVIHAITAAPRPGTVTYKDHIISVHLVDVTAISGETLAGAQAVVYIWSMRDGAWTRAARFRLGQELTVRAKLWYDVEDEYGRLRRADLDDPELDDADPCWAEDVTE